jgi:hypothetical protein
MTVHQVRSDVLSDQTPANTHPGSGAGPYQSGEHVILVVQRIDVGLQQDLDHAGVVLWVVAGPGRPVRHPPPLQRLLLAALGHQGVDAHLELLVVMLQTEQRQTPQPRRLRVTAIRGLLCQLSNSVEDGTALELC